MPTITDVAELANVSKTTVSRYLNGKYEHMSDVTRRRIEEAIQALQYQPSLLASSLKTKQTRSIGVVVSNIENPFFAGLVRAIERIARSENYNVILCNTADDPSAELDYINTLLARQVEGLLLATSGGNRDLIATLTKQGFPIVLIDREIAGLEIDVVSVDNEQATRLAVEHLIELGHARIGVLTASPLELSPRVSRINAYETCLAEHGLEKDPSLVWVGPPTKQGGNEGARKLLSLPEPPTAILATVNVLMLGALEATRDMHIDVPDRLSLITFDDVDWVTIANPPLTTIAQPVAELAHAAMQRLFLGLNSNTHPPAKTIRLPAKLMVRDSTGSAKGGG